MKFLADTQLLLCASLAPRRLSAEARQLLTDPGNDFYVSVVTFWEVAIKRSVGKGEVDVEPRALRRALLDHGFRELPVGAEHTFAVEGLPWLHKDPFDRLLLAQAIVEGIPLLTGDRLLSRYPCSVRAV